MATRSQGVSLAARSRRVLEHRAGADEGGVLLRFLIAEPTPDECLGPHPVTTCQDNRPHVPSFSSILHSILLSRYSVPIPSIARCCGSCEFAQYACPCGVPWPRLPFWLAFDRWLDSVLQDYGIDTVSALHTAEGLDVVFTGVMQVVVPLGHEQARATSTGSRRELFARWKRPNGISTSVLFHRSTTLRFFYLHSPFHDSASRLLFDALCSWLQSVTAFSAIGNTLAPSHDWSMKGA